MIGKRLLVVVPFLFGIYLIIFLILTNKNNAKLVNMHFDGKIERVEYSDKSIPTIWVSGQKYNLTYLQNFRNEVKVGYHIKKRTNDNKIVVINNINAKTYYYEF